VFLFNYLHPGLSDFCGSSSFGLLWARTALWLNIVLTVTTFCGPRAGTQLILYPHKISVLVRVGVSQGSRENDSTFIFVEWFYCFAYFGSTSS